LLRWCYFGWSCSIVSCTWVRSAACAALFAVPGCVTLHLLHCLLHLRA
jgi:hypothetical protein